MWRQGLLRSNVVEVVGRLHAGHRLQHVVLSHGLLNRYRSFRCPSDLSMLRRMLHTSSSASTNGKSDGRGRSGKESHEDEHDDDDDGKQAFMKTATFLGVSVVALILLGRASRKADESNSINWEEFKSKLLLAGEVERIVIFPGANRARVLLYPDAVYRGKSVQNRFFTLVVSNTSDLEDRIRDLEQELGISEGVHIEYNYGLEPFFALFSNLFLVGILFAVIALVRRGVKSSMKLSSNMFNQATKAPFTLFDPRKPNRQMKRIKFSDVAGLREAKIEVKEFVDYLKQPQKYKALGAKPPKGALLLGPPGCGKTLLAKAVAFESQVPFLSMNGSEFVEMISGVGAARVRSLFKEARQRSPAIVYIDEIDAIGRKRKESLKSGSSTGPSDESDQTLNQLLVEMDGMATSSDVILLASTNRADVLDRALLRPGRFDRHINIDLPTLIERKEILLQHMKGVSVDNVDAVSERLATLTPGFSGADLANVINEAALHAARVKNTEVTKADLEYAIERVIGGTEKKSNVLQLSERRKVAYHESGHALVGWLLPHTDALLKVTILPRTSKALGFAQYTPVEKKLYCPDELLDRMCMALGGRVAEALTFNSITSGAANDLEKVTQMAYAQIKSFGFNEVVGPVSFVENEGSAIRPYSRRLQSTMDLEARKLISVAYRKTEALLKEHKDKLKIIAEALLQKETLNYDDVVELIGVPPHPRKHLVLPSDFEREIDEQAQAIQDGANEPQQQQ